MSWKVTTRIWETSPQKGGALMVLLAIGDIANEQGEAWPSIATVAKRARMSERQVYKLISHLMLMGELAVASRQGPGHTNRYKVLCADYELTPPPPVKSSGVDEANEPAPLNPSSPPPCRPGQGTPEPQDRVPLNPSSPKQSLNSQGTVNEQSARARPKRQKVTKLDDLVVDDELREWASVNCENVNPDRVLLGFREYCLSKEPKYKDYRAAFRNSLLKQQQWWEERHPKADIAYGDYVPDSSPARDAHQAELIVNPVNKEGPF